MTGQQRQFYSLYLTKFASSFGYITVMTLIPTFINILSPSGLMIGLFFTVLELARTGGIIPLGWAGDRYDKRTIILVSLLVTICGYISFAFISTSVGFLGARTLQGLGMVGTGMIGLALMGDLAPDDARANYIGKYNSTRMAAGVAGTIGAGALYQLTGFDTIFGLLAALLAIAFVGIWLFVPSDESSVEGFAFADLAFNERILTLTSFRAQYAVSVTLVRKWIPIFVGVSAAQGGLGFGSFIVGVVLASEKFTNMLCQPFTGRLSDRHGRALFVFVGGGLYGLVALAVPFAPGVAGTLGSSVPVPVVGSLPVVVLLLVGLNGLLGIADSFREPASMALFADEGKGQGIASSIGIRSLVWKPGSVLAPMLGGYLMGNVGMQWVFFIGGLTALTGVATFLGVLSYNHGRRALVQW